MSVRVSETVCPMFTNFLCVFASDVLNSISAVLDIVVPVLGPVWARGHCRISPPRFLAEFCKRQLNQGSFVLLYLRLFTFSDLY